MRSLIQKLNWIHLVMLASLPVVLALINPNWIFNVGAIRDDYIYWGYQMDLPKYLGWSPSADHYFIERVSWVVPTYLVRQVFSPIVANFIVHLSVFYLAIFSVYGTLNRLFNARVALFICLLMGQFSLFLRAVGWDYLDGYAMALTALCVLFLTYAATSARYRLYLILAGGVYMVNINAQFFHLFYTPALALYYLFLNHGYNRKHIAHAVFWGGLGAIVMFIFLSMVHYSITGNLFLFQNTMRVSQNAISPQGWRDFINSHRASQGANYHLFFGAVALLGMALVRSTNVKLTVHTALVGMFALNWAVLAGWAIVGYHGYLRLPFYNTNTLPSAFMVIGAVIAGRLSTLSPQAFRQIIAVQSTTILLLFSVFCFVLYDVRTLIIGLMALVAVGLMLMLWVMRDRVMMIIALTLAIGFFSFVGEQGTVTGVVYHPDRMLLQRNYELIAQASVPMRGRYDDYSAEQFYFWFANDIDPLAQADKFSTGLLSAYWYRYIIPYDPLNPVWDATLLQPHEIIVFAPPERLTDLLSGMSTLVMEQGYQMHQLADHALYTGDSIAMHMVFFSIELSPLVTMNRLYYDFNHLQEAYISSITGFDAVEIADGRTYRWTTEPTARIIYRLEPDAFDPSKTYQVQLLAMAYLEEAVRDSLSLTINGEKLAFTRTSRGADSLFTAQIDGAILAGDMLELVFETDGISRPADFGYPDPRTLGVAFDWLIIEPIEEDVP